MENKIFKTALITIVSVLFIVLCCCSSQNDNRQHHAISSQTHSDTLAKDSSDMDTGEKISVNYRKLYAEYIKKERIFENHIDEGHSADYYDFWEYIYLDADDIPELVLHGYCAAAGCIILSVQNEKVVICQTNREHLSYIPRSGLVLNRDGNMGFYPTCVFCLDKQFNRVLELLKIIDEGEIMEDEEKGIIDITTENYDDIRKRYTKYYRGDSEDSPRITEEEFNKAIYTAFTSKGKPIDLTFSDNCKGKDAFLKEFGL